VLFLSFHSSFQGFDDHDDEQEEKQHSADAAEQHPAAHAPIIPFIAINVFKRISARTRYLLTSSRQKLHEEFRSRFCFPLLFSCLLLR
jgi:hypothetical protein